MESGGLQRTHIIERCARLVLFLLQYSNMVQNWEDIHWTGLDHGVLGTSSRRRDNDIIRLMECLLACRGSGMLMLSCRCLCEVFASGRD